MSSFLDFSSVQWRVKFIKHNGKNIIYQNFSGIQTLEEAKLALTLANKTIATQLKGTVLAISDVTNVLYSAEMVRMASNHAKLDKPYVKAEAIVGLTPMMRMFINPLTQIAGRPFYVAKNLEDAKNWLVKQP